MAVLLLVQGKEQFELGGRISTVLHRVQYEREVRLRVMDLNIGTMGVFEMVQSNVRAVAGGETWEVQTR